MEAIRTRLRGGGGKYQVLLLLLLAGLLLLLLPSTAEKTSVTDGGGAASETGSLFSEAALEERLEQVLSQVEGAGEVQVVLTLEEGVRRVLAQEGKVGESSHETTTVLVSQGSGYQSPVELQELAPCYRGALVVAQGADDPAVQLALTRAVSALTGLGTDKITICKGK